MLDFKQTEFYKLFTTNIKREGSEKLLDYLCNSDFFSAPASARFHLAEEGGLHRHSVNVYKRLLKLCEAEYGSQYVSENAESIAIVGLLHDLCKIRYYKSELRNVKVGNAWVQKPYYKVDETFPFGHGEKSVFLIAQFLKLTPEEALAVNWHMGGFDDRVKGGSFSVSDAFYKYNFCLLAHIADLEASYFDEERAES